jgi:pyrroline-5-carboxylate reductase
VIEKIGIIGVGHLAAYLIEGLRSASSEIEIMLSPRNTKRSGWLASRFGAKVASDNQAVADDADLILVTTRPADVVPACQAVHFHEPQTVVSTAVGLPLASLRPAVEPAKPVRAMPLTCAAINRSPTLLYPASTEASTLFAELGTVHMVEEETQFTRASAIAAYYGWVYALMDETAAWTANAGVPQQIARELVLETTRGAAEMGLAHPERELSELLDSLATEGGVTRDGLQTLRQRRGLSAWVEALEAVLERTQHKP